MRLIHRISTCLFLFSILMLLVGCTSGWVSEADNIIVLLVPAITGVLSLLSSFGVGVPAPVMAAVSKYANLAVQDLNSVVRPLLDAYNNADPENQPQILVRLQAALQSIQSNFRTAMTSLSVPPQWQDKVMAVMQVVESEIETLLAVIPVLQGKKKLGEITPPLTAKQFKHRFNELMSEVGPQFTLE